MNIVVYRTEQEALTQADQKTLLNHGLACPTEGDAAATPEYEEATWLAATSVLAIGTGAGKAILQAAAIEHQWRLSGWNVSAATARPDVLVLLAPAIASDAFASVRTQVARRALAIFKRVILLHSPHDVVAGRALQGPNPRQRPCMASAGLHAEGNPPVDVIDITGLIEDRRNAARGALCSYEAMGLIRRLLRGVPPAAAITPFAQLKPRP